MKFHFKEPDDGIGYTVYSGFWLLKLPFSRPEEIL
jgi:hypothetical protein